ncbi:hypothetical protein GOQ29_12460 [Clostridium sp. D2Q-14]|uniref:hypothetical protein n=1 Tax=Anaeromonas gelatinilytica TaxID=2683194 RepID=UPI00193C56AE|nr:hypothetical protein [Anaeromonas gelatinilytica]MBS4536431.1 hypothetical protein [Anaeromonas gelatinilytica]
MELSSIFQFLIIYIIFSNLIKIGLTILNRKKIKEKIEENEEKQNTMKEGQPPIQVVEKVTDPICNSSIEKEKSYIIVEDEGNKYFCSWECRQRYLEQKNDN